MTAPPKHLGDTQRFSAALTHLAATIDARAGTDAAVSYTAKLLADGSVKCAKKFGEEAVELAIAISSQDDQQVAAEAADALYHMLVAVRSRDVSLDAIAAALEKRQSQSGHEEKASRPKS
jgi:phosphoribosyl-ATP pyrophosphohydrolase